MAGTSDIYTSQVSQLQTDLQYWETFINQISGVIQEFNENMSAVQEQLDSMQNSINALTIRVERLETGDKNNYIKLSQNMLIVELSITTLKKQISIYTNYNKIYVYSDKDVTGITFNYVPIKGMRDNDSDDLTPFTSFTGSATGESRSFMFLQGASRTNFTLYFTNKANSIDNAVSLNVITNKNAVNSTYLLSDSAINTTIQQAIDTGINTNAAALTSNKIYLDTTLSAKKLTASAATTISALKPTSITNIATTNNVAASAVKTSSSASTVTRSSGNSKSSSLSRKLR